MARTPRKDAMAAGGGFGAVPQLNAAMRMTDVGVPGLRAFSGWVREEFLPELVGRQGARVYREMGDNSPIVAAVLFAIMAVMRKVEWRTKPPEDMQGDNASKAAEDVAEFADTLRHDMSHTWEDFVVEALSMLRFGYAPHEIVYKVRAGRRKFGDKVASSRFDDGAMGWARLPLRGQETVLKWFFDENGQWTGLTQQPWTGTLIDIPAEKLLLFRPQQHKGNPEGYSILRSAYRPYYFIKRLEEGEAILFERMSGIPVVRLPNQLFEAARGTGPLAGQASAILAEWKKIVRNLRIDEQMGLVIPSDPFPNATGGLSNVPQYEFKLETPNSGRANLDANTPIARHKQDILTATLTDFILMGHDARGAQNLGETKMDLFMTAVEGWLNAMAGVMNRDAIPRVMALNGVDEALWPTYAPDLAQRVDLDGLSNFILRLAQSGMPLFPDPDLQTYLRDVAGMPVESEDGAEERARNASPQPPGDEPEDVKEARARLTELVKAMQAAKDETPLRRGALIAKRSRP